MGNIREDYKVPAEKLKDRDYEKFIEKYNALLAYLKTINFSRIFKVKKTTLDNYKTLTDQTELAENELTDKNISEIISYINFLSEPTYEKYWNSISIPNRSSQPNYDTLNDSDREEAKSQFEKKLQEEDLEIRLMHYIDALHKKLLIYKNSSIRNYYINLCTAILLKYSKSHPQEIAKIHFRFKSPKGLATKLAKNVIVDGHFERNPETGIDTFKYSDISDAFGAKFVSEKSYSPYVSSDKEVQELINIRDNRMIDLINGDYEIFNEKIETLMNNEDPTLKITYREYYQKCLDILKLHLETLHPNAKKVKEYIQQNIEYIESQIQDADIRAILDDNITFEDYKIFTDPQTNYNTLLNNYKAKIASPLSLAGLKKGLNKIFYNLGTTDDEIIENQILSSFGARVCNSEYKSTSSGHEAIHYDFETPHGNFELQAEDIYYYRSDQTSHTAAHSLMEGKEVPLYRIPKPYDKSSITNPCEFLEIKSNDGTIQFYKKSEIQNYYECVENLTAKKGKISYNDGLENAQIDLYSSFYDYFSLAMEIPDTHEKKSRIKQYFKTLGNKPFSLKTILFRHIDTITKHADFSVIKAFIQPLNFDKSLSNTDNSDITPTH